jgi:predicted metalloenzyme YecM
MRNSQNKLQFVVQIEQQQQKSNSRVRVKRFQPSQKQLNILEGKIAVVLSDETIKLHPRFAKLHVCLIETLTSLQSGKLVF